MAKVTGKFQITLPKAIVESCRIRVGDDLHFDAAGEAIQIRRTTMPKIDQMSIRERLAQFDAATQRQVARQRGSRRPKAAQRGWTREELHTHGRSR